MDCPVIDYSHWLSSLTDDAFDEVADAAERVVQIHQALLNDGVTLQAELFRDRADLAITAWEHYPADDCRDPETGAMFYYHAHEPGEWQRDEHGHFHLFVRSDARGDFTHAIAIAMDAHGLPNALFATNGWVTDEKMLPASDVLQLLEERWEINRAKPSWLVVQWLGAMLKLLRSHTARLLHSRDQTLEWVDGRPPNSRVLDDRNRHILSEVPVDLPTLLEAIQAEARMRIG